MKLGILGKKVGMTRVFDKFGREIPVTVIQAGPCTITQVKSKDKDGYSAIQIGFDEGKAKNTSKAMQKHFEKVSSKPLRFVRELRVDSTEGLEQGAVVTVANFLKGDFVDVSSVGKGRGFQGVVKRHKFSGGESAHGSKFGREPASIGQSATPSRVIKGKKLPGQMGNKRITVQNLKVMSVDRENQLIALRGAVPGADGTYVEIRAALKKKLGGQDRKWVLGLEALKEAAPDVPDQEEATYEHAVSAQKLSIAKVGAKIAAKKK